MSRQRPEKIDIKEPTKPAEQPAPTLTLEQATEILNRYHWKEIDNWRINISSAGRFCSTDTAFASYTEFEAIAVAEKLLRDHQNS